MNSVLHEGVLSTHLGWISGVVTLLFLAFFIGVLWWAFAPRNGARFDEAARMPLSNGDELE